MASIKTFNGISILSVKGKSGTPLSSMSSGNGLSVYDDATQTYIANGKANGGTLTGSVALYFDQFVRGLKADSLWSGLADIGITAGWNNLAGAITPLKSSAGSTVMSNNGFADTDYIATGADCGINYYRVLRNTGVGGPNATYAWLYTPSMSTTAVAGFGKWGNVSAAGGAFAFTVASGFPFLSQSGGNIQAFMYDFSHYTQVSGRVVKEFAAIKEIVGGVYKIRIGQFGSILSSTDDVTHATNPGSGPWSVCGSTNATYAGDLLRMYWYYPGISAALYASLYSRANTLFTNLGFGSSHISYHIMGDSISAGYGGTSWVDYLKLKTGWGGRWMNYSLSGGSLGSMSSPNTMASKYASLYALYKPDASVWTKGIIIILCGTNDLGFGATAATLLTSIIALSDQARLDGFKVVVMKILPRQDSATWLAHSTITPPTGYEAERIAFNNGLDSNSSHFTQVIDPSLATGMSDPTNTTYWLPDRLHPVSAGGSSIADYVASVINPSTL